MATCTIPPFNNTTSGDSLYGPRICNQAFIDWAWEAHDFDKGDWDDGFGFDAPCDTNLPLARTFNAIWALNYSAADYWNNDYTFSDRVPPGSVVASIARRPDQIDLFVVGNDGGIYSTWWNPNDGWETNHNWFRIGPDWANVPTNSVVTAIARGPDQIDLFVVGNDGGIYSTWWNPNDGWETNHNWFRIGQPQHNVPQRSVVSAIARKPDQINLFVVGNDGGIYSTWWNPNDGWETNHNWFRIGPDWANVPTNSVVTAIARGPDQIDLFVVGNDGGIYSTWWNPNDGWETNHNWFRIGQPQHNVPQRSVVSAIARKPDQINLFVVGNDGGIYSTWWNPNDGWETNHNWFRIGPDWANVPTNSVVTAIARGPDQIDLFVVGNDGGIYSTWWNPNDGWETNHNWFRIGQPQHNVPQRSVVSAIARKPDQINLFVVGNDGGIYSTWWNPNDGWETNHNWFRIGQQHSILNWACRYVWTQIDELDAACGDGPVARTTQGIDDYTELYLVFFYQRDVVERAGTLLHEARHMGGKSHDADFPPGSALGSGDQADSSWGYKGAWMYQALYLWWFSVAGTRTTQALRDSAKTRANFIINNAFATHPGFTIP